MEKESTLKYYLNLWRRAIPESEEEKFAATKIDEVLRKILPSIIDVHKLISYWGITLMTSISSDLITLRKLIEARMSEVLSSITDIDKLELYQIITPPGSTIKRIIDDRIDELKKG